jgi:GNAT superfamily N-acetyltransferase
VSSNPNSYLFEPFADHDRTGFTCGDASLDEYLHRQANQDAKRKVAASFVMLDWNRRVIGYYTLSAYGIRAEELPLSISRRLPKYPLIPATLLGRLAIHRAHRRQSLGRFLLIDALRRSWRNTVEVASIGVVAEALDDAARDFYVHHDFISLPDQPRELFIAMSTIQKAFA